MRKQVIYLVDPINRVSFANVKTTDMLEYEYLSNYKLLRERKGISLAYCSEF